MIGKRGSTSEVLEKYQAARLILGKRQIRQKI